MRLARGAIPTTQIAKHASQMVHECWQGLTMGERFDLRHWVNAVHAHSSRIAARAVANEKIRKAEMAIGALKALSDLENACKRR